MSIEAVTFLSFELICGVIVLLHSVALRKEAIATYSKLIDLLSLNNRWAFSETEWRTNWNWEQDKQATNATKGHSLTRTKDKQNTPQVSNVAASICLFADAIAALKVHLQALRYYVVSVGSQAFPVFVGSPVPFPAPAKNNLVVHLDDRNCYLGFLWHTER